MMYSRFKSRQVRICLCALLAIVCFACLAVLNPLFAQSPPEAKSSPTPQADEENKSANKDNDSASKASGVIKGRIVSDEGRPVVNATVQIWSVTGGATAKTIHADSQGRFVFSELPAVAYMLRASAPGYVDQLEPSDDLTSGRRFLIGAQVRITLVKGGVITGTVTNAKGEPVVGVPVHASLTDSPAPSDPNLFVTGTNAESDDRGVYRIYGLLPGQYIVSAGGGGLFGQFLPSGFELDVLTFYPSSNRDTAVPITVRAGDESTGIDIKYKGTEGHAISGAVLGTVAKNSTSGMVAMTSMAVIIMIAPAGTSSILSTAIVNGASQRRPFSFTGLADGDYDLLAEIQSGGDTDLWFATRRVTVRAGDVTGIDMTLTQLSSISGTITLDPLKQEDKCDKRGSQLMETQIVSRNDAPKKTELLSTMASFGASSSGLNAKGEFSLHNLEAGKYRMEFKLPTDSWYIRAINAPQPPPSVPQRVVPGTSQGSIKSNSWSGVIGVRAGEHLGGVSIQVGQDAAGLQGRITMPGEGTAIPGGLRLHLVPVEREQADNILRFEETTVNSDGSFALTNLPPGHYFIIARIELPTGTDSTNPHPVAWDPSARTKLRHDAESANKIIELKPCQRVIDYALEFKTSQ